jgi:hypothetical protein
MYLVRKKTERVFSIGAKTSLACTFRAEKYRNDGTITYRGPEFCNTILNVGLDNLSTYVYGLGDFAIGRYINVGTDNTAVDQTQTGLLSFLASTETEYATNHGYSATTPVNKWREKTFEFAIGDCTGNLTELGLSRDSNNNYFNRQLFKDETDTPTTITVLADEGLRITARLYLYSFLEPGESTTGSFLLDGTTTIDFTQELTDDTTWLSTRDPSLDYGLCLTWFSATDQNYFRLSESTTTYGGTVPNSVSTLDYTTGDYYVDFECVWNAGRFVGDINTVAMRFPANNGSQYDDHPYTAFRLDSPITVTDTEEVTFVFRRSWERYAT